MSELTEPTVTTEDIAEIIEEFERYRQRLIDETMTTAQRAKMSKSKIEALLNPELAQIDAILSQLRHQQAHNQ